ncbi:MAG: MlaD family protein [Bacteroidota bacterium]
MKKIRYILTGFFALLSIAILVWGINYLGGNNFFVKENKYYAVYERIDGLVESSPVMIKGLKVGKVREIYFIEDSINNINVLVSFVIDDDLRIPDSSVAEIVSIDLMGSKAINLILTSVDSYHDIGDTLFSDIENDLKEQVSQQMLPLKKKAEDLMLSIDSVMSVIQYIFNESTRENISKSFLSIKKTIQNLERTSITLDTLVQNEKGKLSRIFSNIESISANLRNNNAQLTTVITNFAAISDSLAKADIVNTVEKANSALTQIDRIMTKINNGEGTLGLLLNNDTLYNNLEKAANDLDLLIKDIEANPKKYMHFSIFDFGKTYILDEDGNPVRNRNPKKSSGNGETSDNRIYFKIQVRSSIQPIPENSAELKGVKGIEEIYDSGRYKYVIGNETDFEYAKAIQTDIRQQFPDAFVIAVKNGRTIPLHKALQEI